MSSTTTLNPAERFKQIIDGLFQLLFTRAIPTKLPWPLLSMLLGRLRRLQTRFSAIFERARAGTLPAMVAPRPRSVGDRPEAAAVVPPALVLPREYGWVLEMIAVRW